jgi:hypothetical protein
MGAFEQARKKKMGAFEQAREEKISAFEQAQEKKMRRRFIGVQPSPLVL